MRETRFFECEDSVELLEAVAFAQLRSDGGRTVITLTGGPYYGDAPMQFDAEHRVTLEMGGRCFEACGDGWRIGPP